MKLILTLFLASLPIQAATTFPTPWVPRVFTNYVDMARRADARNFNQAVFLLGATNANDGWGGWFRPTNTIAGTNLTDLIVDTRASGWSWQRLSYNSATNDSTLTRDDEWNSISKIETAIGGGNILLETEIDGSSELAALVDDETGSGVLVFGTSPTLTTPTVQSATATGITTRNDQSDFKITSFTSATNISLSCTNLEYSGALAHNATVSFTDAPSSSSKGRELRIWVTNTGSYTFALGTIGGQSILWNAEGSTTQPALPANTLTEIRLYWNGTNIVGSMSTEPIIADSVNGPDPGSIVVKHTDSTLRSAVKADLVALSIISGEAYDADDWNGETDTAPSLDAVRDEIESLRDVILNAPGITADTDTTNNTAVPIWTNTITTGQAVQLGARVLGAGPTNVYAFDIRALAKNPAGTASLVGTNDLSIIPSGGTNMAAYWDVSGANAILYVRGFNNENVNWRATNILANAVDLGIASGGGGGSPTYLLEENFEGAGYEVMGESGTEVFIQTAIPDDAWAYCMFRYTQDGTVNSTVISFRTSGGSTSLAGFGLTSSSAATLFANGVTYTSSTTLSPNTTYHVWLHWVKGGTCELAISTSTTRPSVDGGGNVYLSGTGSGSSSAGRLSLRCSGSPTPNEDYTGTVLEGSQSLLMSGDAIIIWDKVRMDDAEIGNNPP